MSEDEAFADIPGGIPDENSDETPDEIPDAIPGVTPDEQVQNLLVREGLRIERIVSRGHRSPSGFWYDQDENEWVLLLAGWARLAFAEEPRTVELAPGDSVDIPAHVRHRVDCTSPDEDTVWLAVFYR